MYIFNNTGGDTNAGGYWKKSNLPTGFNYGGSPRIADIDEDGIPEIIVANAYF